MLIVKYHLSQFLYKPKTFPKGALFTGVRKLPQPAEASDYVLVRSSALPVLTVGITIFNKAFILKVECTITARDGWLTK